jgi:hypothetical protein
MKCKEVRKRIYPLLDDELETETNIEVLAHLNVCDRCQEKFEAEREFLNNLSEALTDQEVPEDVEEDIQRRLEEARERKKPSRGPTTYRWGNVMSAAVFLLLVLMAGIVSNQFPLHDRSTADEVIRTFPEYHNNVIQREKETFAKQVNSGTFRTLEEIKGRLVRQFPEFRDQLEVPSLKDNQCEVLDATTLPAENNMFKAPNFHVVYCYMGTDIPRNKSHEGVMLVGVERTDVDLDQVSDLRRVEGADGFYMNRVGTDGPHCIFWKNDRFLMAMITDGLSREHLTKLARSARDKMKQVRSEAPSPK